MHYHLPCASFYSLEEAVDFSNGQFSSIAGFQSHTDQAVVGAVGLAR